MSAYVMEEIFKRKRLKKYNYDQKCLLNNI